MEQILRRRYGLKNHSAERGEQGFTLIELLVTMTIISVLAGIMSSVWSMYRTRANNATAMTDLRNGMIALQVYLDDNQAYPTCATSDCTAAMDGFTFTPGVYIAFSQIGGTSGTSVACHPDRGDTAYVRSSALDLMVEVPITSCGP